MQAIFLLHISVVEAKAPRARGYLGHEAPPMNHILLIT